MAESDSFLLLSKFVVGRFSQRSLKSYEMAMFFYECIWCMIFQTFKQLIQNLPLSFIGITSDLCESRN